jgi:Reverse transcriptase (RNA-dependent DNA polymerase)
MYLGLDQRALHVLPTTWKPRTSVCFFNRVIHGHQVTDSFQVKTGVIKGCLLSPFPFLLAIDWIMKTSTQQSRNGIQWTLVDQVEDLDFADDLALLSHTQQQMQEKTNIVADTSARIDLNIHKEKSKVLKVNATNTSPIMLEDTALEALADCSAWPSCLGRFGIGKMNENGQRLLELC